MNTAPDPDRLSGALAVLQRHWGFGSLREGQEAVIQGILDGRDTLGVLPTGGGKSICYQVPALMLDGVTLVVSPLIALMQDQVHRLKKQHIGAVALHSGLSLDEQDRAWMAIHAGRRPLIYVAPERLESDDFRARIEGLRIALLVVDEAHCISEWGHDFRPVYRRIPEIFNVVGRPPVLALTATATPEVRDDIARSLKLVDPVRVVRGFDRPNLVLTHFRDHEKRTRLLDVLNGVPGAGLVYTAHRRQAVEWANFLIQAGHSAAAYHAGMTPPDRVKVQERWIAGNLRVVVATPAFGMGIDKPDVRFVVHMDLPSSLESYYQEIGRAGRDGHKAFAVLLASDSDEKAAQTMLEERYPDHRVLQRVYGAFCTRFGERATHEAVAVDFADLGAAIHLSARATFQAFEELLRLEILTSFRPERGLVRVRFTSTPGGFRQYIAQSRSRMLAEFVDNLLRVIPADAFTDWVSVRTGDLSRKTQLEGGRLTRGLDYLEQRGLIRWRPAASEHRYLLAAPPSKRLYIDPAPLKRRRKRAEAGLRALVRYTHAVNCRRRFLLQYFGEVYGRDCGACDVCLGRKPSLVILPEHEPLLRAILVSVRSGMERVAWPEPLNQETEANDLLLDWLIQEDYLLPDAVGGFRVTSKAEAFIEQWQPRA